MSEITEGSRLCFEDVVERVMGENRAVGLAVAVVSRSGETLYENFFGLRDRKKGLTADGDTIFGLASLTKSFTSLAIMQLVERGAVSLDAPVSTYIPDFTVPGVTVAHLMSHSGGFFPQPRMLIGKVAADMGLSQEDDGDFAYNEALAMEGERLVARRLSAVNQFIGRPGEYFSYCNDGYALLSAIIKRYGGERTYADYLKRNILEPLEMHRSGCDFLFPKREENVTRLYSHRGGKSVDTQDFTDRAFVLLGGGGMKSTLDDMKNYVRMYLNYGKTSGGERIVQSSSIREMTRPRVLAGVNSYYAFGLRMKGMDELRVLEHGGGLTGVSSNLAFSYEADLGVIVLCNTSDGGAAIIGDAAMKMARNRRFSFEGDANYCPVTWSSELIDKVCGKYVSGEGGTTIIEREGDRLFVTSGGEKRRAVPVGPHTLCVQLKLSKQLIPIYEGDDGEIWGIRVGSRIVGKSRD